MEQNKEIVGAQAGVTDLGSPIYVTNLVHPVSLAERYSAAIRERDFELSRRLFARRYSDSLRSEGQRDLGNVIVEEFGYPPNVGFLHGYGLVVEDNIVHVIEHGSSDVIYGIDNDALVIPASALSLKKTGDLIDRLGDALERKGYLDVGLTEVTDQHQQLPLYLSRAADWVLSHGKSQSSQVGQKHDQAVD
tara:strand:+ start:18953 stop:19525 length:573 start_codon:yes stop_codon:yes gene_type:complete